MLMMLKLNVKNLRKKLKRNKQLKKSEPMINARKRSKLLRKQKLMLSAKLKTRERNVNKRQLNMQQMVFLKNMIQHLVKNHPSRLK